MTNFRIEFLYPWLLLLLIPAYALALFLHLRIAKRYRRTRNRIVSLVLYFIVSTISILTLAGITFAYEVPNMETEVILLVDTTYSGESVENKKNEFVQSAIKESEGVCQVGIVTFGYGEPVYAVPLTTDTSTAYMDYLMAEKPDESATDIADALFFTKDLFKNKSVAKIILISDGMETDGRAAVAVKEIAAEGIEINSVYFPGERPSEEIQIIDAVVPDYNVNVGDEFEVTVNVRSSYEGNVVLKLYDNGVLYNEQMVSLVAGTQELTMTHAFSVPKLHALSFEIEGGTDECTQNNVYYSYIYVETFTKVLMVERNEGEARPFMELLEEENEQFDIEVVNIFDSTKMPVTVDALRQYDQVVLVNIANADMPNGFIDELYTYVNDIGGGLLTVGGNKIDENGNAVYENGEVVPNAYNREDMLDTLYQEILPVQAIDYTPPVAVMLIVDRSGSMDMQVGQNAQTKLELAKQGAKSCLDALTERDYCGIMTLEEKYTEEMQVTPMTQKAKLQNAIDDIVVGGGTVFEDALRGAAKALQAVPNVERRHVILVTDGIPSDSYSEYVRPIEQYVADVNAKVTFSFVIIGEDLSSSDKNDIRLAAEVGGGRFYDVWNVSTLPRIMREELNMKEIKAINHEPFQPQIDTFNSVVSGVEQVNIPNLNGFYGTKLKSGADQVLKGEFVPIYAQWKYGKGMVGSFMCDLNGVWSADFMADATGRRILLNAVNNLFPTSDIRIKDIDLELKEQNYKSDMSVYTKLEKDEKIELEILSPGADGSLSEERVIKPTDEAGYSRISFEITQPGVHQLTVRKFNAVGEVIAETTIYKTFSYSKEYDMFSDLEAGETLLTSLAISGGGVVMDEPEEIFAKIAKTVQRTYDPRIVFMIIAIVLFLLDIAVRKFKFKWPHEIYRDAKAKRALKGKA